MIGHEIAICFGGEEQKTQIRTFLMQNSYAVSEPESKGTMLLRILLSSPPQLLLCDFEFFEAEMQKVLKIITDDAICPVVMLVDDSEREFIEDQYENNEYIHMIQKPVNKTVFLSNLEFILKNIRRINELKKEILDLQKVLENRKVTDRAKAALIKKYGFDEQKAHRYIQRISMETRKPVREIADKILKSI